MPISVTPSCASIGDATVWWQGAHQCVVKVLITVLASVINSVGVKALISVMLTGPSGRYHRVLASATQQCVCKVLISVQASGWHQCADIGVQQCVVKVLISGLASATQQCVVKVLISVMSTRSSVC